MPAAAAIGYYMKPFIGSEEIAHAVLGSLALAFGFLQILALLGRPAPVRSVLLGFKVLGFQPGPLTRLQSSAASASRVRGKSTDCHRTPLPPLAAGPQAPLGATTQAAAILRQALSKPPYEPL